MIPGGKLLAEQVRGRIHTPDDPEFAGAVTGFNPAVQHRPDLVVEATDARDVAAALEWAADHGQAWAVQGTGHAETALLTSGVLITTGGLSGVTVDPVTRTARVGAGTTWRQVMSAAEPVGLTPVSGSAPDVGVVGLLLGGGAGPMVRTLGACSDYVRAVHIVLPGFGPTTVDAATDPGLFATLLGGRPDVGVVTGVDIALLPQQPLVAGGLYYGPDDVTAVMTAYQQWVEAGISEDITTSVAIIRVPDLPSVPPPLAGRTVLHLRVAALGSATNRELLSSSVFRAGTPLLGGIVPMPWGNIGTIHNDPVTPRVHVGGGGLLTGVAPGTIDAVLGEAGPERTSPLSIVELRQFGGAFATAPSDRPDGVPGRDAAFGVWVSSRPFPVGTDPAAESSAVRGALDAVAPWSTGGAALNFSGSVNTADEVRRGWPAAARVLIDEARRRYAAS